MTTAASVVINAATQASLGFDSGSTALANNPAELLAVLSRRLQQVYAQAGLPPSAGGGGYANYFTRTTTITLGTPATTYVAMPTNPTFTYFPTIVDSGGTLVSVVTIRDLNDAIAEYPPAVVIADNMIRSAGRQGDPTAGAVLTASGSYVPPPLVLVTDYLGATTLTDPTTSAWPDFVGNPFLIADLVCYLFEKDGASDPDAIAYWQAQYQEAAKRLEQTIGVSLAALSAVRSAA